MDNTRHTPYYWANKDTTWHFNDNDKQHTGYNFRDYNKEKEVVERKKDERFATKCY